MFKYFIGETNLGGDCVLLLAEGIILAKTLQEARDKVILENSRALAGKSFKVAVLAIALV